MSFPCNVQKKTNEKWLSARADPFRTEGVPSPSFLSSVVFPGLAVLAIDMISKWMHLSLQMPV